MQQFTCSTVDLGSSSSGQKNNFDTMINGINKQINTFGIGNKVSNQSQYEPFDNRYIYSYDKQNEIISKMNQIISNTSKCSVYQGQQTNWNNLPNDEKQMSKVNINDMLENQERLNSSLQVKNIGYEKEPCTIVSYKCSCNTNQIFKHDTQRYRDTFYNGKRKYCTCFTYCGCNSQCSCNKVCTCNMNWVCPQKSQSGYCSCNSHCLNCRTNCTCNQQTTSCSSHTFTNATCSCNSHITSCLCEQHKRSGSCGCDAYCDCNTNIRCYCDTVCTCNKNCTCDQYSDGVNYPRSEYCTERTSHTSCGNNGWLCSCQAQNACDNDQICTSHCMCQTYCSCNQNCYADGCTCQTNCDCENNCIEKNRSFGG